MKKWEPEKLHRAKLEKYEEASSIWTADVDVKLDEVTEQIADLQNRVNDEDDDKGDRSGGDQGQRNRNQAESTLSLIHCLISKRVMVHPVFAADGRTYEHSEIERVFSETPIDQNVISPVTGEAMAYRNLVPNAAVEAIAAEYGDDA